MKKSPEPIILTVALALLALVAAGLAYTFPSIGDLTGVTTTTPSGHTPAPIKADDLQARLADLGTPALWKAPDDNHRLFISDGFLFYASLYPNGNYIQKNDGTARTPGGVLISWYQKYGLNFQDPNIDREDPDGDGFSNKTEFVNEAAKADQYDGAKSTNPLDPQSHPAYLSRLRLEKFDVRPFHIQFVGVVKLNGENLFQIALADISASGQPALKRTGEPLGYEGYTVGPYVEKIVQQVDSGTHATETVDQSTLELDKPEIGFKIILPLRQVVYSPESTADFVMLMPSEKDKEIKVPRGKTFSLPFVPGSEYLVIEVKNEGATIRDTKTKQDISVPKLDPKEWEDVPLPGTSAESNAPKAP
jgi:hypothetical protein